VRIERLSQIRFHQLLSSPDPKDTIHNTQVIHYSRVNPMTGEIFPEFRFVRSSCPWKPENSRYTFSFSLSFLLPPLVLVFVFFFCFRLCLRACPCPCPSFFFPAHSASSFFLRDEWVEFERPTYSNEELLQSVNTVPRFVNNLDATVAGVPGENNY
jgi:hypothetical protein